MRISRLRHRTVKLLLASSILLPYIRLPEGIPDVRPEFILIALAWGLLFTFHLARPNGIFLLRVPLYRHFGLIGSAILLSMVYAVWFKNAPFAISDLWELVKVGVYFAILVFVVGTGYTVLDLQGMYKLALTMFFLSAVLGFIQYLDLLGINEVVSPYYAPAQMRGLVEHGRIVGTTPNPNDFGALMILPASLALSGALVLPGWKLRAFCWFMLPVFVLAIVLTLSRTALVDLVLASGTIILLFFLQGHIKIQPKVSRAILFFTAGLVLVVIGLQFLPDVALNRFAQLATFTEASSWQARIEIYWVPNFQLWLQSPLLGWGPAKAIIGSTVDNEWLLLARRYGLVGVLAFVSFFGAIFGGLSGVRRSREHPVVAAYTIGLQGSLVGYMAHMITAVFYHSMQLMPVLMILVGVAYSTRRRAMFTSQGNFHENELNLSTEKG